MPSSYKAIRATLSTLPHILHHSQQALKHRVSLRIMSCKGWTLTQMGVEENLKAAEKIFEKAWNLRDQAEIKIQADLAYCRADFYNRQKNYDGAEKWLNIQENLVN